MVCRIALSLRGYDPLSSEEEHPESEEESQHELPESESVASVHAEELSAEESGEELHRLSMTAPTITPVVESPSSLWLVFAKVSGEDEGEENGAESGEEPGPE